MVCTVVCKEEGKDRATAIGNMHRKIGEDCECGSGGILVVRQAQTDRHTDRQTSSSQYFATAPAGEVKNDNNKVHTRASFCFPSIEDFKLELMRVIANVTATKIKENHTSVVFIENHTE